MNSSEGSSMMHGRMPVRVFDSSSTGTRLSTLQNTGDSGKRMFHVKKVRDLLPEYSNFTGTNESSSQKENLPSAGKTNTRRTQPVRITATEREPQHSKHKADVSTLRQPVRIVQKSLESPKRNARRRLDTAYEAPTLQTNEKINSTLKKNQFNNGVDSGMKFKNVKSVGIIKTSGKNSENTDKKKNIQRKSFLLPPNTITNRYKRNQYSVDLNAAGPNRVNTELTKNHVKHSDHPEIFEELPENSNKGNSNQSSFPTLVEESSNQMEISSLEVLPLSEARIPPISTVTSKVPPAVLPGAAVQNDSEITQIEHSIELTNLKLSNKSRNENDKCNTEEIQRPSVIVELNKLSTPMTIARQVNKKLSPKISIVETPNISTMFSPVKCSTQHRNSLCQFNHVVSSPIHLVPNNCSLSQFANSLLIVDNINNFKELCTGLESARISELPNECQSITKSNMAKNELQPKISIDKQSLVELELKLKECFTLVGNLLRPNRVEGSVVDFGREKNVQHAEFSLTKHDALRNIKESCVGPQCTVKEIPIMPLVEKPLSVIKSPINKKQNVEISERENRYTADEKENTVPTVILELSPKSRNTQKKYKQLNEEESPKNTELENDSKTAVGSNRKSVNSNRMEPQERRRSARLAAKQMLSPITADDSFQALEKKLNIEHAQSNPCTPCREKTPNKGTKWGRVSERSLREYMVLKSANKFLTTPDPKRFHHKVNSEKSTYPHANESQVMSAKIFNELRDLYSETP